MGKTNRQKANQILESRPHLDAVYMNSKGEFFTEEYLADNSNQGKAKTSVFKRTKKKLTQNKPTNPENTSGGNISPEDNGGTQTNPEDISGADTNPEDNGGTQTNPEDISGADTNPEDNGGTQTNPENTPGTDTNPENKE